jgi:TldD protein
MTRDNTADLHTLFFAESDLTAEDALRLTQQTLHTCDDGELFLEYRVSESLALDDGQIRNASFDTAKGFGLRAICGEATGYAHASDISHAAFQRAADSLRTVRASNTGAPATQINRPANTPFYGAFNPLNSVSFQDKVTLLQKIDAYVRDTHSHVAQVMASLAGSWQAVMIMRPDGTITQDIRPLVRVTIATMLDKNGRQETGSYGYGGRVDFDTCLSDAQWQAAADEAVRQATVNLESVAAPAGDMPVVLGNGWPGILLHEAVGHGLEGDFNRKKTSAFSDKIGQRVAAKGVTIVDDGTLQDRRGSLTVDDEGTPTQKTTLIEDGILTGYMHDRLNARLMNMAPTGNGRRQSYAHAPIPRMTNTYMTNGAHDPAEILSSVKKGLYAVNFGGGQVDITSGKFVFSASEAYLIEDGKIGAPVKGATLIGNGPAAMQHISMIGNDMTLDPGVGTCGKDGQGVPVGVGQPTLKLDALTIGGTAM